MKIGELSARTGVSIRMLRYYEAEGLLTPQRTPSGYRAFSAADVTAVERIRLLGQAGMNLATIREFLPCSLEARGAFEPCDELKAKLIHQISDLDAQSDKLAQSRALLSDLLTTFEASTPTARRSA